MCNSDIEYLNKDTFLLGNLEKVGWVILKSSFNINPYFEMNNDNSKKRLIGFQLMEKNVKCFTIRKNTLTKVGLFLAILQKFTIY